MFSRSLKSISSHQLQHKLSILKGTLPFPSKATTTSTKIIQNTRYASTLVISEPLSKDDPTSIPASTLSTITAAKQLHDGPITLLLLHDSNDSSTPTPSFTSIPEGIASIQIQSLANDDESSSFLLPEVIVEAVQNTIVHQEDQENEEAFSHVVATHSKLGSSFLPRLGALLNVSPVTDVVEILEEDTFIRPMYAGNAMVKVKSKNANPQLLTIRSTAFDKTPTTTDNIETTNIMTTQTNPNQNQTATSKVHWKSESVSTSTRPDLGSASIVISGGRGLQSGENFALLETLADQFGSNVAAVGASRAAVDAGMVSNELQVGQTGKVVAPELYVAVGISGAIQHLSGMKDSKMIVAVNTDPEAPIFQVADYGLNADLFQAVPELTEKLSK